MASLNIILPDDIAKEIANKQDKSRFIVEALKEKIERDKQQEIEPLLFEGYKAAFNEDLALDADWDEAGIEGWE